MEFHSVYLQRRQPGVSYRDFQRLWRSHGDHAAAVAPFWAEVQCYVHNDPLEDPAGLPADTARYDAVGELFYTSYETWLSLRDVMWNEVAPDEKRVFNGPSTAARGDRTVYLAPTGPFKLFTFARLRDGLAGADADQALADHARLTLAAGGFGDRLAGFTLTRARHHSAATGMDAMPQTRSNMDLVYIHHFATEADARGALSSAGYARIVAAEDDVLDFGSRICLMTHGWYLKGAMR